MTMAQLGYFVGALWTVYLVAYILINLFMDQEPPKASPSEPKPEPAAASGAKTNKVPENQPKAQKKAQEGSKGQANQKKQPAKERNIHKIVPLGKAAFCKFCKVYMDDDDFLKTHESGKKHQKNSNNSDITRWFSIVEKPQEELKPLVNTAEEVEEGWTL